MATMGPYKSTFRVLVCFVGIFVLWSARSMFSSSRDPVTSRNTRDGGVFDEVYNKVWRRLLETKAVRDLDAQNDGDGSDISDPPIVTPQTPFLDACKNPSAMDFNQTFNETYISLNESYYLEATKDCAAFRETRGYSSKPGTADEAAFPLAFSVIMHRDVDRAERLLRAIYQPQNFYCIHIDAKADPIMHETMKSIAACLPNVFTIENPIEVYWGKFSVLEVELICMRALWKYSWKYFINLTGQEFPLKTNWELVQIFKTYNGANDVDGTSKRYVRGLNLGRFKSQNSSLPMNLTLSKGSVHVAVTRGFVDFVLHKAQPFIEWINRTKVPDETFFNTLNNSPQLGIPGAFTGEPIRHKNKPHVVRYKLWGYYKNPKEQYDWYPDGGFPLCHGRYQRTICLFTLADLPDLTSSEKMFANKFSKTYEPLAYDCIEAWHLHRLERERRGHRHFDTSYYEKLDFVQQHV